MLRAILFLIWLPGWALADDWQALDTPGAVALMRHALAPGTGDPGDFQLDDCSTQRNLDNRGRDQARRTGAALRDRGFRFDTVLTSQWCRTRETAELLDVGPVAGDAAFNSFFGDFSEREARTHAARDRLSATEGRVLVVTHQVNISALAGRGTRSGEILIVSFDGDVATVLGSILIEP